MIRVVVVNSPFETLDADSWSVDSDGVLCVRKGERAVAEFAHRQWSHVVRTEAEPGLDPLPFVDSQAFRDGGTSTGGQEALKIHNEGEVQ